MTFPQKIGLSLIVAASLATAGHYLEISVPTLRWFYSFAADPELIRANPAYAMQGRVVGLVACSVMALVGLVMLVRGRSFQWNPLTLSKMKRFKSIGRGYGSFQILMVLLVLAMLDQALVGRKALAVKYEGYWIFPAFQTRIYTEKDFGGESEQEADFRKLKERFEDAGNGDRVILPPVPWDPVFDSEEKFVKVLPTIEGEIFSPDMSDPYSGFAVKYQSKNPELKVREARIRKGLPEGPGMVFDAEGQPAGRETWKAGEVVESTTAPGFVAPESGSWMREYYPPIPPNLEQRHFIGTDSKGWDLLAQLYGGLQVVLKASVLYLGLTYGIGVVLGLLMGYFGGKFDIVMQRVMEVLSNVPFLLVVMIITNNIGRDNISLASVILIFGLFSWIGIATYLRTSTFKEKARDYAQAAHAMGAGTARVIFRHIMPNAISTIVTLVPFSVASVVSSLTALDFLGFGVPDRYPSWGRLLGDGVSNLSSPWIVSSVFVAMVCLLMLITFIGEAIREAFDPKKFTTYQ